MKTARIVFSVFSVLFQPLYALMLRMLLMYVDQMLKEENPLAQALDVGILVLGIVFMVMQGVMLKWVWAPEPGPRLRRLFRVGLGVWFFLEVVLSYWWCLVTGTDPLTEHTPFVVIFLLFNLAQYGSLKRLGVLGTAEDGA